MTLSLPEYLGGAAFGLLVWGAAVGCAVIATRRLGLERGAPAVCAFGLIATALLMVLHLIPASLGLLGRPAVGAVAVLLVGTAVLLSRRLTEGEGSFGAARPPSAWPAGGAAAIACGAVAVYVASVAVALAAVPPQNVDTLTFHLPGVGAWIESGSIWQIDQFVPDQAHGYYPNGGNLIELAAILPWHSDFAVRLLGVPFLALSGIAVYAIGRELSAPARTAALMAAAFVSMPVLTIYTIERPIPDLIATGALAGGILFGLRHARTAANADLALAGLGLAIAFATKWYGVSSVIALMGIWIVARLMAGNGAGTVVRQAALAAAPVALLGGPWLLRNAIESGNPVYPAEVSAFGVTLFGAPPDPIGDAFGGTVAGYITDLQVLADYLAPALRDFIGAPGLLALVGVVAGLLSLRRAPAGRVFACSVAAVMLALVYAVTPFSALGLEGEPGGIGVNLRYLTPALTLAFPLAAWAVAGSGRARPWLEGFAVVAVADGLLLGTPVELEHLAGGALIVAAAVAFGGLYRAAQNDARPVFVAGVVVSALAAGFALARSYTDDRYLDTGSALRTVIERSADQELSVGLAGFWPLTPPQPVLPAFGPRYGNSVEYVGRFERGMLRPFTSEPRFGRQVAEAEYDLLLIGREPLPLRPDAPEVRWALRHGYRVLAGDDSRFTLLEPAGSP